ncbi:MAG: nuclear transport factor 2 family protein [Ekhidna sp.]|nr:nuclear transport factor 2 family protein [Ekhidna sp.]
MARSGHLGREFSTHLFFYICFINGFEIAIEVRFKFTVKIILMMTTEEVAQKWKEYCLTGQMDQVQEELYAIECVSLEMEGVEGFTQRAEGMEAIKAKGKIWEEMVEEFHGLEIEGPIVAGDHFSAILKMDITMKEQPRRVDEEVAVYRVANGKIVSEQFFYDLG